MQKRNLTPLNFSKMDRPLYYFFGIIFIVLLIVSSYTNFLFFHTVTESISIIISVSIFIIAWNTRMISQNSYLLFLGFLYLFVGMFDFMHTISYKGIGIFPEYGANLPTQLWIITRYLESISLLVAPLFLTRKLNIKIVFITYLAISITLLVFLFVWPIFPDCFIEGHGLTAFKKNSEYIISFILLVTIYILYKKKDKIEKFIFKLLVISLILTVFSEISFTFYVSVYGFSNLVGHIFKLISFYLIYKAVIVTTLRNPYETLFMEITKSEKEKDEVILELKEAMSQVKLLEGFLPICSSCKQIRDDKGYWNQVETYISKHTDIKFSHSVCPSCVEKLYPEVHKRLKQKNKI